MKHEEIKRLIGNVIDNEFMHVQEYEERHFVDSNTEQMKLNKKI